MSPEHLVLDPEWQPFAYEPKGDRMSFVHLPREAQRQRIFLDGRHVGDAEQTGAIAAKSLPRDLARSQAGPLHFIFHTAFCCSTLLTRAFDVPGASMGLKEPQIIGSFADAFEHHPHSFDVSASLGLALDLLSRPLAPGETQIVKPSNLANSIVPHLLDVRPDAKAIIMHSSLETYLRATAQKSLPGRAFNREALMMFRPTMSLHPDLTDAVVVRLTDLEVAAVVWLMQMRFLNEAAKRYGARIRTLRSVTLLDKPAETLRRAGDFFAVTPPESTSWEEIAAGPVFREHAKALGRPFNAEARRIELETAGEAHAQEIASVIQWAEGLAGRADAPMALGDTLFRVTPLPGEALPPGSAVPPAPPTPPRSS